MNSTEEATIHKNGSVTIRYYYGKTVTIPGYVMADVLEEVIRNGNTKKV